jgi:superfamily I DNA and RNA helicase
MAKLNTLNWHEKQKQINTFYEAGVAYHISFEVRDSFFKHHREDITIPFFSKNIFTEREAAILYIPTFIKELITDGSLPENVIKNNQLDETLINPFVRSVNIAAIKAEKIEAEGRLDLV